MPAIRDTGAPMTIWSTIIHVAVIILLLAFAGAQTFVDAVDASGGESGPFDMGRVTGSVLGAIIPPFVTMGVFQLWPRFRNRSSRLRILLVSSLIFAFASV